MTTPISCPGCHSENIYADGILWICPECSHEWTPTLAKPSSLSETEKTEIRDATGKILQDGDTVTLIKELRIKGSASAIKVGTKVKNIRLTEAGDGHDIACKIDGFGAMNLKSVFVKKVEN
jgi:protein PhnA